jgi:hypothetical protein
MIEHVGLSRAFLSFSFMYEHIYQERTNCILSSTYFKIHRGERDSIKGEDLSWNFIPTTVGELTNEFRLVCIYRFL